MKKNQNMKSTPIFFAGNLRRMMYVLNLRFKIQTPQDHSPILRYHITIIRFILIIRFFFLVIKINNSLSMKEMHYIPVNK